MAVTKKTKLTNAAKEMEQRELSCIADGSAISAAIVETSAEVPQKTRTSTTVWCNNPTTGISQGTDSVRREDICTPRFVAALFTTAKVQNQPRCPLADERVQKVWHLHQIEYYSDIKKIFFMCSKMNRTGGHSVR
jgi:hypothetical protein